MGDSYTKKIERLIEKLNKAIEESRILDAHGDAPEGIKARCRMCDRLNEAYDRLDKILWEGS